MRIIKWGMIGVGDVTEVKSGPAFYKTAGSSLFAVTSRTLVKADDYAKRHQVEKVHATVDDLVIDPDIDIVYVATPPSTHREYAIAAMQAGKSVYVEKPMAMTTAEAVEMNHMAQQTGTKLYVAFYRRALPYFQCVRDLLSQGVIGELLAVSVRLIRPPYESDLDPAKHTWRINKQVGGDGYFVDMAPHTFDILDYLLSPIKNVTGQAKNLAKNYEVPDTVSAVWQHENNVLGSGIWCFSGLPENAEDSIVITGTEGQITCSTFDMKPIELVTSKGKDFFDFERPQHIQQALIETIVEEMLGIGHCPSTGETALRTTRVIEKILAE